MEAKSKGGKIALYSRKSRFTGQGESVENQIEWCRRYVASHFPGVGEEDLCIYEDEGFSGGNTRRPQFQKMMKAAGEGAFSAVVCYRLDRVSRNIGDFARLIFELSEKNTAFISIKEQFDTGSPLGRAMMFIASVFAQLEHETIAERIRDNMHELAKSGRWLGGITPTGFASAPIQKLSKDGRTKKVCRLVPIPGELALVRLIFARFLSTGSLTQTVAFLSEEGRTTKNGRPFTRFAVKNILQNPVYMTADADAYDFFASRGVELCCGKENFDGKWGVMAYNKTLQKAGKANKAKDMGEWIITVGGHKGTVPGADWAAAYTLLEKNGKKISCRGSEL